MPVLEAITDLCPAPVPPVMRTWELVHWLTVQVRITGGTGAGQRSVIASNTGTVLTFAAMTVAPDATSIYAIEGDENTLYLMGNNAVTLYKYSISANTWVTLTPGVARSGVPGLGTSGNWIRFQPEANWNDENAIINGRKIYSFRGAATPNLDYYDIPSNTWTSIVVYLRAQETFTTGTAYAYTSDGFLYIQQNVSGRFFRYSPSQNTMDAWSTLLYTQGAAAGGDRLFDTSYTDGATTIRYINFLLNTSTVMLRQMVI